MVEKPNGTDVYVTPFVSIFTSGSKPGRCSSTTTACEKPIAAAAARLTRLDADAPGIAITAMAAVSTRASDVRFIIFLPPETMRLPRALRHWSEKMSVLRVSSDRADQLTGPIASPER